MKLSPRILIAVLLFTSVSAFAQDTVVVRTLTHKSQTRDTVIAFPEQGESYEKVLMLYNMRCKNALVSDGNNRNRGCGEWDYSCNTYITDSSKIDSLKAYTAEYGVPGYSGSNFNYAESPIYDRIRYRSRHVQVNAVISEDTAGFGTATDQLYMKPMTLLLFTAQELSAAGLQAGEVDGILLPVGLGTVHQFLRIGMMHGSQDSLDGSEAMTELQWVYHDRTDLVAPATRLAFHTAFVWDGTSPIIIAINQELSGKNPWETVASATDTTRCLSSFGAISSYLNGEAYVEAEGYDGVLGNQDRSISAWIKTEANNGEILSYGKNATGQKWVFRINDDGRLRVEINGGYIIGSRVLTDGKWHHVACVLNGSSLSDIDFYVDGIQDVIGTLQDMGIDTRADIPVRISLGVNNRYFIGEIEDIRFWDRALSAREVRQSRGLALPYGSTHPLFSSLQLAYAMGDDSLEFDVSGNARHGIVHRDIAARNLPLRAIRSGFEAEDVRPDLSLVQGTYDTSHVVVTLWDSVAHYSYVVTRREVNPNYGTILSDELVDAERFVYWNADEASRTFDSEGNELSSDPQTADGTIALGQISYMRRFPSVFEIMSFVTPYGIGLDLGKEGKTWTFDVTDFLPILHGNKRFYLSRGGQNQEEMDIRFLFIKGTPAREVLDIAQIWPTAYTTANNALILENDVYFPPVQYPILPDAEGVKLRSAITGHGQEGEFIPREHWLTLNGQTYFSRSVWKACGRNPIYPQGGTWIYDRAGWCPGMATDVAEYDITDQVSGGDTIELDYGMETATGDSRYIINNQIVTYGAFNHSLDAGIVDVLSPSNKVEYSRDNPSCTAPVIRLQNLGSSLVHTVSVEFWVNDESNKRSGTWSGTLKPMETFDYALPIDNSIWSTASESGSVFHARIVAVNGKAGDDYAANNHYASPFQFTEVWPAHIYMLYRTNNAAHETSVRIVNDWGQTVYSRSNFANNQLYRDTVLLGLGCHSLIIDDNDGDGIDFWANNDGTALFRIMNVGGGVVKTLEGDFGTQHISNFTVLHKLDVDEQETNMGLKSYPNPAGDQLILEGADLHGVDVQLYNNLGQVLSVPVQRQVDRMIFDLSDQVPGVYLLRAVKDGKVWENKLIVQ